MNDGRRKMIAEAAAKLGEAMTLLEIARDEEQGAFDNMPESFQQGDRGEKAQGAVDGLNEVIEALQAADDTLQTARE